MSQDSVQNYKVSLTLDPKVMQWFAGRGNGNFIFAVYLSCLNYPPEDPQCIVRAKGFTTNPGGSIATSKRYPGQNATGHFSTSLTFVVDPGETSACMFGSIGASTSNISFQLRTTTPQGLQTGFMVAIGADGFSPNRVPTTDSIASAMIAIRNGEASSYQGTGTFLSCPLPVTGFQGVITPV